MSAQEAIGLVGGESFQGTEPMLCRHVRRDQQMHVVRHHYERMQFISMKPSFPVTDSINHQLCDRMLS